MHCLIFFFKAMIIFTNRNTKHFKFMFIFSKLKLFLCLCLRKQFLLHNLLSVTHYDLNSSFLKTTFIVELQKATQNSSFESAFCNFLWSIFFLFSLAHLQNICEFQLSVHKNLNKKSQHSHFNLGCSANFKLE